MKEFCVGTKEKAEPLLDPAGEGLPVCRLLATGKDWSSAQIPSPTKVTGVFVVITQLRVRPWHPGDAFEPLSIFDPIFLISRGHVHLMI